jgi:hypothetical protein
MRRRLLARHDIDEEIKHIRLCQRGGDVRALQRPPLVILCVDPGAHGQLGDEDVAALCEEDGCLSRDHLDLRVGFHDFLYAGERQLVDLVVVVVGLEVVDGVLPVCR